MDEDKITEIDLPKRFMNGDSSMHIATIYTGHAINFADWVDPESEDYPFVKKRFTRFILDAIWYAQLAATAVQHHRGLGCDPAPNLIRQTQQFRQAVHRLHAKVPEDQDVRTLHRLTNSLKLRSPKPG